MRLARFSIALAAALFCAHAAGGQDAPDPKEAPARGARGLPQFESNVLSGNQTKPSAYRRVSNAKDPEAPAASKDAKPRKPEDAPKKKLKGG